MCALRRPPGRFSSTLSDKSHALHLLHAIWLLRPCATSLCRNRPWLQSRPQAKHDVLRDLQLPGNSLSQVSFDYFSPRRSNSTALDSDPLRARIPDVDCQAFDYSLFRDQSNNAHSTVLCKHCRTNFKMVKARILQRRCTPPWWLASRSPSFGASAHWARRNRTWMTTWMASSTKSKMALVKRFRDGNNQHFIRSPTAGSQAFKNTTGK